MTQEELDRLYSRFIGAKKNSKAYWEAKSNYHLAYANFHMEAKILLQDAIKDAADGKTIEANIQLEKDKEDLKRQLKTAGEELEEEKNRTEAEYTEITEELKMLLSALGISSMEWERAKSLGKLPTGQLL